MTGPGDIERKRKSRGWLDLKKCVTEDPEGPGRTGEGRGSQRAVRTVGGLSRPSWGSSVGQSLGPWES